MTYAGTQDMASAGSGGMGAAIVGLIELVFLVAVIAGLWKIFTKAGQPGWAAIVPIYNGIVMLQIAKKPIWWIVLFLIPIVNFVIGILVAIEIAKKFKQGVGFGIGMVFLPFIFYPMLGFGSATYQPST
jgi:hypothetical protein